MAPKKSILILSFSWIERDPRVYRQIKTLEPYYNILVAGYQSGRTSNSQNIALSHSNKRSLYQRIQRFIYKRVNNVERAYWVEPRTIKAFEKLKDRRFDLILANDINSLPLAVRLGRMNKAKIILDAHEYTPRDFDDRLAFRWFQQDYWHSLCHRYLPQVDAMFTVCEGLATEYQKNFHISCNVLMNLPYFENQSPHPVKNGIINMIHHGGLTPSRRLENMIYLMDQLDDRFRLDFMLIDNDPKYLSRLKKIAASRPKINFIEPVPMSQISKRINSYDIGLFLLWPGAFSYKMALPNKLFEFVQGRLAVAIWPSPEMAKIVKAHDIGIVSDQFTTASLAVKLNRLDAEKIMDYKLRSGLIAAKFCAETNEKILLAKVEELLT